MRHQNVPRRPCRLPTFESRVPRRESRGGKPPDASDLTYRGWPSPEGRRRPSCRTSLWADETVSGGGWCSERRNAMGQSRPSDPQIWGSDSSSRPRGCERFGGYCSLPRREKPSEKRRTRVCKGTGRRWSGRAVRERKKGKEGKWQAAGNGKEGILGQ